MRRIIMFYTLTLLCTILTWSQEWQLIGPPGGRINGLRINPKDNNIIFAGTQEGVLFKSTNGGATTKAIYESGMFFSGGSDIAINPINDDTMYTSVSRSTDGGETWTRMSKGGSNFAINTINPNCIFTASYGKQLWVTSNAGENWSLLYDFMNYLGQIKISSSDTNIIYADANDSIYGLYKSTDSGLSWEPTTFSGNHQYMSNIHEIFINPFNSNSVYIATTDGIVKTINGGDSWDRVLTTSWVNDMASNPLDTNTLYAVTGDYLSGTVGNVFKTTNGGSTWEVLNSGLPSDYNRYLYEIEINQMDEDEVYVGTYGFGVYKTTNGGQSWLWTNITQAEVLSIYCDTLNNGHIYAGTRDEGIIKSTNGGLKWNLINFGVPKTVQSPFREFCFNPHNHQVAYETGGPYGLLKSTDGGLSWEQTTLTGNFETWAWSIAVHPTNSETLYVGQTGYGNRDLYRSTDGGMTWENLFLINSESRIEQIQFDRTDNRNIYICAGEKGLYKSTDDGLTWMEKNSGLIMTDPPLLASVVSMAINNESSNILFLVQAGLDNYNKLFKSTNGGDIWIPIDSTLVIIDDMFSLGNVHLFPQNPNYLFVSSLTSGIYPNYFPGGLFLTNDNGLTWKDLRIGPTGDFKFDPFDPNKIYICTQGGIYTADVNLLIESCFHFIEGWNMISLPVQVSDSRKNSLYPNAISDLYSYVKDDGYKQESNLKQGVGYWLKLPTEHCVTISGTSISNDTIQVTEGWNLIGSISIPISTSSIQYESTNIMSYFFGYNGTYFVVDTLEPGKGYWIKVDSAGHLILSETNFLQISTHLNKSIKQLNSFNKLIFEGPNQSKQTLYFGENPDNKFNLEFYELPPSTPENAFEVRFSSQRFVEIYPKLINGQREFSILIKSTESHLLINMQLENGFKKKVTLSDEYGNILIENGISSYCGDIQNSDGSNISKLILKIQDLTSIPLKFELSQCYPNPFNPMAIIEFNLPTNARVTLTVFDLLGREVRILKDGEEIEAGRHKIKFDASTLSSGLYFYRIIAKYNGHIWTNEKKMLLIK